MTERLSTPIVFRDPSLTLSSLSLLGPMKRGDRDEVHHKDRYRLTRGTQVEEDSCPEGDIGEEGSG